MLAIVGRNLDIGANINVLQRFLVHVEGAVAADQGAQTAGPRDAVVVTHACRTVSHVIVSWLMLDAKVSEAGGDALTPVPPEDRVVTLDILRGFAMFGVLWSNLNDRYGTLAAATPLNRSLAWIQFWLVDGRFYSLLGFLFGIGFAIQLQRTPTGDLDRRNIFLRRMLVLLGIGIFHGLFIWSGDILTNYALLGFLLLLYRGLSQKRLALATALTYLFLPYLGLRVFLLLKLLPGVGLLHGEPTHGTYAQIAGYRIQHFLGRRSRWAMGGEWAAFLTLFLLGMLATRARLVSKLLSNARQDTRWLRWALGVSLLCTAAGAYWDLNTRTYARTWWPDPSQSTHALRFWLPRWEFFRFGDDLFTWGSSATYALALAMLSLRPAGRSILAPLAAVGRMALTTYLTQSIVCTTLFYGYGFHLWGHVGFEGMLGITLTIFSLQMVASVYWLRHFRFGPAEWLWRSIAYVRAQPMKKLSSPTTQSVAC
jgi:uncharacterized protein